MPPRDHKIELDHVIEYVQSDLPTFDGNGHEIISKATNKARNGRLSYRDVRSLLKDHADDMVRWSRTRT